jgi:glycosyltransferase involved in cell wall biosynthesis
MLDEAKTGGGTMRGTKGRNRAANKSGVADDLIRQVSESVVARSTRKRNRPSVEPVEAPVMRETAVSEPAVALKEAPVAAPVPMAPVAPVQPAEPVAEKIDRAEPPAAPKTPPVRREVPVGARALAMFCYLEPECAIGQYIAQTAPLLAERGVPVHIFSRHPFNIDAAGVTVHELGLCEDADLLASVNEYTLRALNAFLTEFSAANSNVAVLGFEWSSVKALLELSRTQKAAVMLSLHSLECQRSDLSSELSRKIQELEIEGLQCASTVLIHSNEAAEAAGKRLPDCRARLVHAAERFPVEDFTSGLDAGVVKARFQIGPVDPTILFVGNFDDAHAPDVLMKAAPAILKNHPQARFVLVGDGPTLWPMRVHARYLLLEHAVRFPGHLEGKPLRELIEASDIVCVPSRQRTEDWPILAAWAAKRAVLTTHPMAGNWLKHEQDSVHIYPQENSCVWGIERILFDEDLRKRLAANGHQKVLESHGWSRAAAQLETLIGATVSA